MTTKRSANDYGPIKQMQLQKFEAIPENYSAT